MKHFKWSVVPVVILMALAALGAAPTSQPSQQWQYANLATDYTDDTEFCYFHGPDKDISKAAKISGHFSATAWVYVYRELGGTKAEPNNIDMLNQIGISGWELVTIVKEKGSTTYFFKRPTP